MNLPFPALLPALVFVPASAMESFGWPDFHDEDKQAHAWMGAAVGAFATATAERVKPQWRWWEKALVGVATSAVVGVVKEVADSRSRDHDCDPKDAEATVVGGAAGSLCIELVWRF